MSGGKKIDLLFNGHGRVRSTQSGAIELRMVLVVVVLLAVGGVLTVLVLRRPALVPQVEIPSVPLERSRTNLVLNESRLMELGADTPFTGSMVEHYSDGALRSRSFVSNGLLEGLSHGYYTNGQVQVTEPFTAGVSHGVRTKWYPDGTKQSEAGIVQGKLHGTFRRWHENGELSEQIEFVDGQPEGESLAFFPSGYLKARVIMKEGKPIEQKFWEDGEQKP